MKHLLSIGLLSAMLLGVQLALIQALTFVQGHHLAYVVLSVALLGFGAGGSLLTLFRKMHPRTLELWYAPLASFAGVSVAWLPRTAEVILQTLEVDLLFTGVAPWVRLGALGAFLCVPFCAGALALSIVFRTRSEHIGGVYAANLIGSALGASLIIPVFTYLFPETLLPLLGILGVLAGGVFSRRPVWWHGICILLVVMAIFTASSWRPSQYRDVSYALQLPDREELGSHPHYHGRLDTVVAPALRYAPDLSLQYRGAIPAPPHYFVNGDRAAVILDLYAPARDILAHTPHGLPYALQQYASILFLAPEGNAPVVLASQDERASIQVVMPHPLLVQDMRPQVPENVELVKADPRSFLASRRAGTYDLIVFPPRGLFGGPTGLQTLGGDMLFTVEGVSQALDLLAEAGWLAFPVWLDDPLRHSLRVLALIREGAAEQGIHAIQDHLIILRGWGSVFFMVSMESISEELHQNARGFAKAHGFDLIHPHFEEDVLRHGAADESPALWFRALLGPDADAVLQTYRFDVSAPTDARPFFNQFIRPGDWGEDLEWLSVSERGLTVLYVLLIQLAVAVVVIVFLPLWPLRKQSAAGSGTIGYFSGLGAGFMLYEVALIQLLIPLWGDPVTGAAFVITTLLIGMSLGSFLSGKMPSRICDVRMLTFCCSLCLMGIGFSLPLLIRLVLPYTMVVRMLVFCPVLLFSAVLLGMPFPCGIRFLADRAEQQIPWACGIDGGVAVLAAPSAALLAFYFGYPAVVMLAAGAYVFSAVVAHVAWKKSFSPSF